MSYLRIRFNFWVGFLYHATWNFLFVILVPFAAEINSKKVQIIEDEYEITLIEKSSFSNDAKTILYSVNSDTLYQLEATNFPVKDIIAKVSYEKNKYKPIVENLDANLVTEKGIPTDTLISILIKEGIIEKITQTE